MLDFLAKFQDESTLLWYYGKDEKQLDLRQILRIIPGQRTVSLLCLSTILILIAFFLLRKVSTPHLLQRRERTG